MARRAETLLRAELRRVARESERRRSWLAEITLRCRGMAPGLARQALYSDQWPPTAAGKTDDE